MNINMLSLTFDFEFASPVSRFRLHRTVHGLAQEQPNELLPFRCDALVQQFQE